MIKTHSAVEDRVTPCFSQHLLFALLLCTFTPPKFRIGTLECKSTSKSSFFHTSSVMMFLLFTFKIQSHGQLWGHGQWGQDLSLMLELAFWYSCIFKTGGSLVLLDIDSFYKLTEMEYYRRAHHHPNWHPDIQFLALFSFAHRTFGDNAELSMCSAGKELFKVILLFYCDEPIKMIRKSKIVQYDLKFKKIIL